MKNKHTLQIGLLIFVVGTLLACSDEEKTRSVSYVPNVRQLTSDEQIMKDRLEETTLIVRDIVSEEHGLINEVNDLIRQERYNDDIIPFNDLLHPEQAGNLKSTCSASGNFGTRFREAYAEKPMLRSSEPLEQYLVDKGICIYCPYPLTDYMEDNRIPTIVSHPIDNEEQNTGYELQPDGTYKEVLVNEAYAATKPVWIIFPAEYEEDLVPVSEQPVCTQRVVPKKAGEMTVTETSIGEIFCKDYCSHFFEGKLELRILRSKTAEVLAGDTWTASGSFDDMTPINLERKYVRYARNGWDIGWFTVNVLWDSDWKTEKTQQVIAVYEEDPSGEIKINGTAKYYSKRTIIIKDPTTGIGAEVEVGSEAALGCTGTFKSRNDILGVKEWDRNWFFKTLRISNGNTFRGSFLRDGWAIRSTSPDFWFTTKVRVL